MISRKHTIASVATNKIMKNSLEISGVKDPYREIAYEQTTVMALPKKITRVEVISLYLALKLAQEPEALSASARFRCR
jgi:hypothetical protein